MAISRKPKNGTNPVAPDNLLDASGAKLQSAKEKRQALTREKFIQSGHDLLREVGREKLSLREVARRSDYSPAAIYEYFGSKQDLIDEIANRILEQFAGVLNDARAQSGAECDPLTSLAMAYVAFAKDHHHDFLLVFGEQRSLQQSGSKVYQVFVNALAFQSAKRNLDPSLCGQQAYRLWTALHGLAMLQITHFGSVGEATSIQAMGGFVEGLGVRL